MFLKTMLLKVNNVSKINGFSKINGDKNLELLPEKLNNVVLIFLNKVSKKILNNVSKILNNFSKFQTSFLKILNIVSQNFNNVS